MTTYAGDHTMTSGTGGTEFERAEARTAHNYHPLPVVLARGEGAWVEDSDGRRYLDMLAGYGALNFGHRNPRLVAAAEAQLGRLTLTSRAFHNDPLSIYLAPDEARRARVLPWLYERIIRYGAQYDGGLLTTPNSIDGANTSALWLQAMGWVNGTIGGFYLLKLEILPFIAQVLAWRPAPLPELLPAEVLRPALARRSAPGSRDREQGMAA